MGTYFGMGTEKLKLKGLLDKSQWHKGCFLWKEVYQSDYPGKFKCANQYTINTLILVSTNWFIIIVFKPLFSGLSVLIKKGHKMQFCSKD